MGAVAVEILDLRPLVDMHVEIRVFHPLPSQFQPTFFQLFVGFVRDRLLFSIRDIDSPSPALRS